MNKQQQRFLLSGVGIGALDVLLPAHSIQVPIGRCLVNHRNYILLLIQSLIQSDLFAVIIRDRPSGDIIYDQVTAISITYWREIDSQVVLNVMI